MTAALFRRIFPSLRSLGSISVALFLVMALPAISGNTKPPQLRPSQESAILCFINLGQVLVGFDVFLDREYLGTVKPREYNCVELSQQIGIFRAKGWAPLIPRARERKDPACRLFADLKAGNIYYAVILPGNMKIQAPQCEWKDETTGASLLAKAKQADEPSTKDQKRAAQFIEVILPSSLLERFMGIDTLEPSGSPLNSESVALPARTVVFLKLMTTITSNHEKRFDPVWFTVDEDVVVDGEIVLRRGTPVRGVVQEVVDAKGHGRIGHIEVDVHGLEFPGGTSVPFAMAGFVPKDFNEAEIAKLSRALAGISSSVVTVSAAALPLTGFMINPFIAAPFILIDSVIQGDEAYILAGQRMVGITRASTTAPRTIEDAGPNENEMRKQRVKLTAKVINPVHLRPHKRDNLGELAISIEGLKLSGASRLVRVGEWSLPNPIQPVKVTVRPDHAELRFDAWSVARCVIKSNGTAVDVPLILEGETAEGLLWSATATLTALFEERPAKEKQHGKPRESPEPSIE